MRLDNVFSSIALLTSLTSSGNAFSPVVKIPQATTSMFKLHLSVDRQSNSDLPKIPFLTKTIGTCLYFLHDCSQTLHDFFFSHLLPILKKKNLIDYQI